MPCNGTEYCRTSHTISLQLSPCHDPDDADGAAYAKLPQDNEVATMVLIMSGSTMNKLLLNTHAHTHTHAHIKNYYQHLCTMSFI